MTLRDRAPKALKASPATAISSESPLLFSVPYMQVFLGTDSRVLLDVPLGSVKCDYCDAVFALNRLDRLSRHLSTVHPNKLLRDTRRSRAERRRT